MFGQVEQYKDDQDFESYMECMEQFFLVNNIVDKKYAWFIKLISPKAYVTLKDLWALDNPSTKSLFKNVRVLNSCIVQVGKTVSQFLIKLKNLLKRAIMVHS